METEHVNTIPLLVQGSVLWNLLANSSIGRGLALGYTWKWHLTIRCCKKFLVMRKQTKFTSFCSRDENSQLVNKSTNRSLQFKHPFASTLQWNIQLIQVLKNVSQERKASNEQIIWKKVAFSFFRLCRKSFTSFLRIKLSSVYYRVKATSQPCKVIKCCALHFQWSKDPW